MLISAHKSDVGRVRSVNEDRAVVRNGLGGLTFAVVADGMGGHQAGDTASQITVEILQQELEKLCAEGNLEECAGHLREAIRQANAKVFEIASSKEHYRGMGTTVTAALADAEHLLIGHIGDSRAYLVNGEDARQLTEDHTLVYELLKSGQITPEEAQLHPRRHVVTRALGTDAEVEIDIEKLSWHSGDTLVICSDGLSNLVDLEDMIRTLRTDAPLQEKADLLVQLALDAGGDDNITVVLLNNE
ncbi:Stp1/IreP family PP2C-type Ser/Thr phosphatase [Paenibacillus thermotolerans]|uniref:Stp1/IreP family PP2C-type Ser/Thr phosphatase n=1 Tax=Paenibacillus thermotolerans TaxID=3027807 RepID=UPI002368782D|nr:MULTISPECIES: Stp1/IreP family PP2C-type Ser/Thr phosphatase [unclassified Paenibacillus]